MQRASRTTAARWRGIVNARHSPRDVKHIFESPLLAVPNLAVTEGISRGPTGPARRIWVWPRLERLLEHLGRAAYVQKTGSVPANDPQNADGGAVVHPTKPATVDGQAAVAAAAGR